MEVVAEKKEFDNKNSSNALDTSSTLSTIANLADKEAEDRERQARDLKAGFHPLKVKLSLFSLKCISIILVYQLLLAGSSIVSRYCSSFYFIFGVIGFISVC